MRRISDKAASGISPHQSPGFVLIEQTDKCDPDFHCVYYKFQTLWAGSSKAENKPTFLIECMYVFYQEYQRVHTNNELGWYVWYGTTLHQFDAAHHEVGWVRLDPRRIALR